MSEFKREKVLFHIIGQGKVEVEYEVGAETPEEAFRRAYDESVAGITRLMIVSDVEFVTTVATEPMQDELVVELNRNRGVVDANAPYKVMLGKTEWLFPTIDDAENFIRRERNEAESYDPDWESRINWTNRSDVELAHHLSSDHGIFSTASLTRTELNNIHERDHTRRAEREEADMERAREDEADQWRMNR